MPAAVCGALPPALAGRCRLVHTGQPGAVVGLEPGTLAGLGHGERLVHVRAQILGRAGRGVLILLRVTFARVLVEDGFGPVDDGHTIGHHEGRMLGNANKVADGHQFNTKDGLCVARDKSI